MTTPLLMLRALEIGIPIADLSLISIGLLLDMWTEKANDTASYKRLATQVDFDRF
ncbi:hypothetical protein [Alloscardovia omnicolens]|uniref:hypothetical protein n=1 Tax=Alloscardovia omnicolens TaxID=419015 RepID=UPI003A698CE9